MPRLPDPRTLRKRRRVLEVSMEDVARRLRVGLGWISQFERGWKPNREDARRRYAALARSYARLLDEIEKKSRAGHVCSSKDMTEEGDENSQHDAA